MIAEQVICVNIKEVGKMRVFLTELGKLIMDENDRDVIIEVWLVPKSDDEVLKRRQGLARKKEVYPKPAPC